MHAYFDAVEPLFNLLIHFFFKYHLFNADTTIVWHDKHGHSCGHYEAKKFCPGIGTSTYGPGWALEYPSQSFADLANDDGVDATQACCSCAPVDSNAFITLQCDAALIAAIGSSWRDIGGHTCKNYVDRGW